jgi:hypothetical protein
MVRWLYGLQMMHRGTLGRSCSIVAQVTLPFAVMAEGAEAVLDAAGGSLVLRLPFRPFSSVHAEVRACRQPLALQHVINLLLDPHDACVPQISNKVPATQ